MSRQYIFLILQLFLFSLFGCRQKAGETQAQDRSDDRQNQLQHEKSPYLLQHADNPVNWYPWGQEAFKKAEKENKPIFLSVGYSTCYWCHVMERKVFMNEE